MESVAERREPLAAQVADRVPKKHGFEDFWTMPPAEREAVLLQAITETHAHHFTRNSAYRRIVSARGVGPSVTADDLPRLLRPTAQTFKSYIDILSTPFPHDNPQGFLAWLADQLSIDLPRDRFSQFQSRYGSLEALLADIERVYADLGLEVLTSSGTSGRSTIMLRDAGSIEKTVESFYLAFQRILGMRADHRAIFIMPRQTRIAMARMAGFSVRRVGLDESRIHFTIPFSAEPDQVRIQSGRTFRPGWRGLVEMRLLNPFMNWMNANVVTPRSARQTLEVLEMGEAASEKVLVFGGWVQLHRVALELLEAGRTLRLAPGSLVGTGGGMKDLYPFTPAEIRADLEKAIRLTDSGPVPVRDVYGMAEANWAAMQCREGNYHIPPWIHAVVLDEDDAFRQEEDSTGLLAFFDPIGGGNLFPAFFRSADQVRLIRGRVQICACGEDGAYIARESIQRMDLLDEAGCAAQI